MKSNMPNDSNFIEQTKLAGVYLIKRPKFDDERGFFHEIYRRSELETLRDIVSGGEFSPAQANHSHSNKGTLRGIHIAPWHKLVTVTYGQVQQVVVDCRSDSKTFGQHLSLTLDGSDPYSVFIQAGCGNSFLALSDTADYIYLASDEWAPGKETSIIYNDPDLNIPWQTDSPLLSDKDLQNPTLRQLFPNKFNT